MDTNPHTPASGANAPKANMTEERFNELLRCTLANQRIEGIILSAEELASVTADLRKDFGLSMDYPDEVSPESGNALPARNRRPTSDEVNAALISARKNNAIENIVITDEEFSRARIAVHLKHRGLAPDAPDAPAS